MSNEFLVSICNDKILIMNPQPGKRLTIDEALNLAAYIVAIADPLGNKFQQILEQVKVS